MERRTVLRAAGVISAPWLVRVQAQWRMRRVGVRSSNPRPAALGPGPFATGTSTTTPRRGTSTATWARVIRFAAAVSVLAAVSVAHAQPGGSVPRVGYLSPYSASDPQIQRGRDLFELALRELGYVEGQNVAIENRWAEGKDERLPRLAAELVHSAVDVIVAAGGVPSARAAQQATRTIPIVLGGAVDPVGAGLVASLVRPGATHWGDSHPGCSGGQATGAAHGNPPQGVPGGRPLESGQSRKRAPAASRRGGVGTTA